MKHTSADWKAPWLGLAAVTLLVAALPVTAATRVVVAEDFTNVG